MNLRLIKGLNVSGPESNWLVVVIPHAKHDPTAVGGIPKGQHVLDEAVSQVALSRPGHRCLVVAVPGFGPPGQQPVQQVDHVPVSSTHSRLTISERLLRFAATRTLRAAFPYICEGCPYMRGGVGVRV